MSARTSGTRRRSRCNSTRKRTRFSSRSRRATEIGEGDPKRQLSRTVKEALQALNREMQAESDENEALAAEEYES